MYKMGPLNFVHNHFATVLVRCVLLLLLPPNTQHELKILYFACTIKKKKVRLGGKMLCCIHKGTNFQCDLNP